MFCHELRAFGLEHLVEAERPRPVPGPREVLVRVEAVSLNYRDWLMVRGEYNPRQPLPLIPLSDGAGTVVETGDGVTRVQTGDRVAAAFCPHWISGPPVRERLRQSLGGPLDGMLCEFRVLPEDGVVRIPTHLSTIEAATLPCAAVTAWSALIEHGRIQPGETVVVQGTGGVAIFALQFAKLAGARVIVTSSSEQKLERARQLGADAGIHYPSLPEWSRRVKELTAQTGADHIIEVGGAGTLAESLRAIRMGGTISVIGVLGGKTAPTSLIPILMQQVRLQGITVGSRETFETMNRALTSHQIRPVVDQVFSREALADAFRRLGSGAHFGKIVVRLD